MKINRTFKNLSPFLIPGKVLVIYGPRQVGKTTIVKDYLSKCKSKYRFETGDNITIRNLLSSESQNKILEFIENYELIVIDEAQKIPNIGTALKIMVDFNKNLSVIATGSSSFELAGQLGEPLTGRKTTLHLYPIAQCELNSHFNTSELKEQLEFRLVFGNYPEIITAKTKSQKQRHVIELCDSYLLKDILALDKIRNSKILIDLLRLMAFQVGSEVSLSELGTQLRIDGKTVARYLDILEKAFVLLNVRGFSRNLRKEINKKSKYYFYDNGIRNALIANFNDLELRNDTGALWENFIFMERLKYRSYFEIPANYYFWKTWNRKEIDLIEERDGNLFAFEFKWNPKKSNMLAPKDWTSSYPQSKFNVITVENYLEFVTQMNSLN